MIEKMIEEMAKDLSQVVIQDYGGVYFLETAKELYNLGYRKIPKGSVVLSKEEYELYDVVKKGYPNDMACLAEKFTQIDHNARKETAKEIFEKVLSYIGSNQKFCIVDNDNQTLIDCDKLWEFVGILAKQFGVEIKE